MMILGTMSARFVLLLWMLVVESLGALELALPFSDHAVLQAGVVLPVWGKAEPGVEVRVSLGDRRLETRASADGDWRVSFPAAEASGKGMAMEVAAGDQRVVREDLVFGEVWIATGQSNMSWKLKDCATGKEAMEAGDDAELRVLNFQGTLHPGGRRYAREFLAQLNEVNYYESGGWQRATAETLGDFSGVGYFFARRLRVELGVPVGVIHLAVGGSPMEAHLPREDFLRDEKLRGLLNEWWKNPEYPRWCRERAALNLTEWLEEPVKEQEPPHPFAPSFLWNAGVAPLLPFPVKGVLWYQGESNATIDGGAGPAVAKEVNRRKFEALIQAWRGAWEDDRLPVYFVQLPGLNRDWELFREMQLEVSREVPGVGMAVTIDVGDATNVHPTRKRPVGERLAGLALEKTYGLAVEGESPVVMEVGFEKDRAWVIFDQAVEVRGGGDLKGFELAGEDGKFRAVTGVVQGKRVSLEGAAVVAVRYAWADDPAGNLVGERGLPVSPFRRVK